MHVNTHLSLPPPDFEIDSAVSSSVIRNLYHLRPQVQSAAPWTLARIALLQLDPLGRARMVFPGRFSTGCLRCRQRKVKVSDKHVPSSFVFYASKKNMNNKTSCSSAMRQNPRVGDVITMASHVWGTRTSSISVIPRGK